MKLFCQIILPILILAGGVGTLQYFLDQKKPPRGKTPVELVPIVQIQQFEVTNHQSSVSSFGVIEAYDSTPLVSQLSGKIESLNRKFRVGNVLKKGALLAQIEKADFLALVAQRESELVESKRALAEERVMGQQAKDDWQASGRELKDASEFVLREPQLAAAEATVLAAEETLKKAKIDLQRTEITVPFTSIVMERSVSEGRYITPQTVIGTLVDSTIAEVPLTLTAEQLERIDLTKLPLPIKITDPQRKEVSKVARITRVSPAVDPTSQSTFVIAEIEAPYEAPQFPVGTFVNAQIPAASIDNALAIPESAFVNNQFFWAMREGKLQKVEAKSLCSQEGTVFLKLEQNETSSFEVIIRPLTSFRNGMKVREKGEKKAPRSSSKKNPEKSPK